MNFLVTLVGADGLTHTEWCPMYPVPPSLTRVEPVDISDIPKELVEAARLANPNTEFRPVRFRKFDFTGTVSEYGARVYRERIWRGRRG